MSNSIFQTLGRNLKEIGNRTLAFRGFSIIFSGDLHQLKPVGSNEKELMFLSLSGGYWDKSINVVIVLNKEHPFKEDPEYGQMLTRMWSGDLSKEDHQKVNTRVIGYKGLKLPATSEGKQSVINHFIPIWN